MQITSRLVLLLLLASAVVSASLEDIVQRGRAARADASILCYSYTCAAANAECDMGFGEALGTTISRCAGDHFCKFNNATQNQGTCTAYQGAAQPCVSSSECQGPPFQWQCISGTCNKGFLPGAECSVNSDCLFTNADGNAIATCIGGRCAGLASGAPCGGHEGCLPPYTCGPQNTCINPQPAGGTCASTSDCQKELVCIGGSCASPIANGASCNVNEDGCRWDYVCAPSSQGSTTGACRQAFSGRAGELCADSAHCSDGMFCSSATDANAYGTCLVEAASSKLSCNASDTLGSSACNANETCYCNGNNGQGVCGAVGRANPSGTQNAAVSFANCASRCGRNDYACLASRCKNQACRFYNTLSNTENPMYTTITPECARRHSQQIQVLPGYIDCNAGSYVQYSLFGLLFVIIALLF